MQLQAPTHLLKLQITRKIPSFILFLCMCVALLFINMVLQLLRNDPFSLSNLVYCGTASLGLEPVDNLLYDVNKLQNYFVIIYCVMSLICECSNFTIFSLLLFWVYYLQHDQR